VFEKMDEQVSEQNEESGIIEPRGGAGCR